MINWVGVKTTLMVKSKNLSSYLIFAPYLKYNRAVEYAILSIT